MSAPSVVARVQGWDDSSRPEWADADERCAECARMADELAAAKKELLDARVLLRKIQMSEPKTPKPEFMDTPADCILLGYVSLLAVTRARIGMFLKGAR